MESGGEESLLLIPWREGYLPPEEFQNTEHPGSHFTFQSGDGILPGEGPELSGGHIKPQLPQARMLSEVHTHRPGSPLDHWEVLAR